MDTETFVKMKGNFRTRLALDRGCSSLNSLLNLPRVFCSCVLVLFNNDLFNNCIVVVFLSVVCVKRLEVFKKDLSIYILALSWDFHEQHTSK